MTIILFQFELAHFFCEILLKYNFPLQTRGFCNIYIVIYE